MYNWVRHMCEAHIGFAFFVENMDVMRENFEERYKALLKPTPPKFRNFDDIAHRAFLPSTVVGAL